MNTKEIQFRGKRIDKGNWIYGYLYQSKYGSWITDSIDINLSTHRNIAWFQVEPETVCQLVCKIDGRHIYTNDLMKHGETIRIVNLRNGNTCLDRQNRKDTILLSFCPEAKKVGNIFDNPELLNEL